MVFQSSLLLFFSLFLILKIYGRIMQVAMLFVLNKIDQLDKKQIFFNFFSIFAFSQKNISNKATKKSERTDTKKNGFHYLYLFFKV